MLSQLRLFSNDNNGHAVLLSFVVSAAVAAVVAVAVAPSCFRFLVAVVLISCACHTHTELQFGCCLSDVDDPL